MRIKIFQDAAYLSAMTAAHASGHEKVFTTNPLLMCKADITDYKEFALKVIAAIPDLLISFEVVPKGGRICPC